MHLNIHHITVFQYSLPATSSINEVWLRPLTDGRQSCLSFSLSSRPRSEPRPYTDHFGNTVYVFGIRQPHTRLEIIARAVVETRDTDLAEVIATDHSPYKGYVTAGRSRWLDFLVPTTLTAAGDTVHDLAGSITTRGRTVPEVVRDLADRVTERVRYRSGVTTVATTAEEVLRLGAGVCQDHTHVFLAACRALGIPARFVRGFLCGGAGDDQEQAPHAWPEALLPRAGWVGLDVANGRLVDGHYVAAAVGRDYADVPPVRGSYTGPEGSELNASVYVVRHNREPHRADAAAFAVLR